MAEDDVGPDPLETMRQMYAAFNRGDLDAYVGFFAPDAVVENVVGRFEGRAAIRHEIDDLRRSFEAVEFAAEEAHDLGNGVVFGVVALTGRPYGTKADVETRYAVVVTHANGAIVRAKDYSNIDEARAAAERLAQGRG